MLARVLEGMNIPCRLEIGPEGGHGFADGSGMCMAGWTERAVKWFESLQKYKENPDLLLIANMTKILVITAESRQELHEAVYQKTIDTLIESILNLIFEQEE